MKTFTYFYDRVGIPLILSLAAYNIGKTGWNWLDGTFFVMMIVALFGLTLMEYFEKRPE